VFCTEGRETSTTSLPESISSTSGLVAGGWKKSRILRMWIAIALSSGLTSLAGYGLFQHASSGVVAFVLTFAPGRPSRCSRTR